MNFYIAQQGQRLGPFSQQEVEAGLVSGRFRPTDLGWREGMATWEPLHSIGGLAYHPYGTAPAVPGGQPMGMAGTPIAYGAPQYGGFWKRAAAMLIDQLVLLVPTFILGFFLGATMALSGVTSEEEFTMAGNLLGIAVTWLYFAAMESSPYQATLGKLALGMKVTDTNGNRISFGRASGRHFGKIVSVLILGIGFIMAAFTQKKQALHDLMADTLVVNK